MGVNELVLGAPWVVGGGGMVGGVSLDCVFTSTGESGIVECFSVRSATHTTGTHRFISPSTPPLIKIYKLVQKVSHFQHLLPKITPVSSSQITSPEPYLRRCNADGKSSFVAALHYLLFLFPVYADATF